jgi:MIP family channel proteins
LFIPSDTSLEGSYFYPSLVAVISNPSCCSLSPFSDIRHLNPAVTFALVLAQKMKWFTGLLYVGAQCLGAIVGAALTYISTNDVSEACNGIPSNMNAGQALLRELVLTFLLVFVVFGTIDPKRDRRSPGPLSIGFAVIIAHLASVTSTGTGINPARSLGPAVVQSSGCWDGHWVFWIGPMLGGALAGYIYEWFFDWG